MRIDELPIATIPDDSLHDRVPFYVEYPPFHISVVKVDHEVFAIEDACNHAGASLTSGEVTESLCILCPLHRYVFDLRTGALMRPQGLCGPQRTFRVEQSGSTWLVFESPRLAPL